MSRDFKNFSKPVDTSRTLVGYFLSTLTGLAIGLLVAFLVYIYKIQPPAQNPQQPALASPEVAAPPPATKAEPKVPEPTFDFYTILPERDVNISEWVEENPIENAPLAETAEPDGNLYIFQVGSFEDFESADQLKARLALIGVKADIQRVVINGRETTHRVRVGPYKEQNEVQETRELLLDNNIEFMLLRLNTEEF